MEWKQVSRILAAGSVVEVSLLLVLLFVPTTTNRTVTAGIANAAFFLPLIGYFIAAYNAPFFEGRSLLARLMVSVFGAVGLAVVVLECFAFAVRLLR